MAFGDSPHLVAIGPLQTLTASQIWDEQQWLSDQCRIDPKAISDLSLEARLAQFQIRDVLTPRNDGYRCSASTQNPDPCFVLNVLVPMDKHIFARTGAMRSSPNVLFTNHAYLIDALNVTSSFGRP